MFETQTHCKNGHELTEENRAPGATVKGKKQTECRICKNARHRDVLKRQREAYRQSLAIK